jgi:hypothetical protein
MVPGQPFGDQVERRGGGPTYGLPDKVGPHTSIC